MIRHIKYWLAKARNDFLRLFWFGPNEAQAVQEVMLGLERDAVIKKILDEHR